MANTVNEPLDRYERVGKLQAETFRTEHGQGARAPEVFECQDCGALVADTGKIVHSRWHSRATAASLGMGML